MITFFYYYCNETAAELFGKLRGCAFLYRLNLYCVCQNV